GSARVDGLLSWHGVFPCLTPVPCAERGHGVDWQARDTTSLMPPTAPIPRLRRRFPMAIEHDPATRFAEYAHPERLVTTDWLQANLGREGLVVVESDEDVLLYETGHIPG